MREESMREKSMREESIRQESMREESIREELRAMPLQSNDLCKLLYFMSGFTRVLCTVWLIAAHLDVVDLSNSNFLNPATATYEPGFPLNISIAVCREFIPAF